MTRRYLLPVFLGAFLLFLLQPMAGKRILPEFGGGSAVWTTCMLLFQALLLGGYAYAHGLATRFPRRTQGFVHAALIAVSLPFLAIILRPSQWMAGDATSDPAESILVLLARVIGPPYLLLATTGPLMQAWASQEGKAPYRLYAVSNAASFLALVCYPFAIEPWISLRHQFWIWCAGYVAYGVAVVSCALSGSGEPVPARSSRPPWLSILQWIALAAVGSTMLLAVTNQVCQEVAVIPFLWVLPLALYLATFTICFDHERWYDRRWWSIALAVLGPLACVVVAMGTDAPLLVQVGSFALALVALCMVCHGELALSKPPPDQLTTFYLAIAAGGALGGVFVALIAPRVFSDVTELPIALAAGSVLGLVGWWRAGAFSNYAGKPLGTRAAVAGLALAGLTACVMVREGNPANATTVRNFYGILRVADDREPARRVLTHGRTVHGYQFQDPLKRDWPTTYYGPRSGIGLAMQYHPRRASGDRALHAGIIGLGVGTIAAYGQPGDDFRFYEINPAVERLSREMFTYRKDSSARLEIVLGDARLSLEREAPQNFDVLAVDAFSSDSIPAHLLTRECAAIYRSHLKPDGLLLLHISNRSLDLTPVARGMAQSLGWHAVRVASPDDADHGVSYAVWIIITRNEAFLNTPAVSHSISDWDARDRPPLEWTDDFTSLWRVLRF